LEKVKRNEKVDFKRTEEIEDSREELLLSSSRSHESAATLNYGSQEEDYYEYKSDHGDENEEADEEDLLEKLFLACNNRNSELLRSMLQEMVRQKGYDIALNKLVNSQGNTLLHSAAYIGWIEGIHVCLSFNIDINVSNVEGNTPLHLAKSNGHQGVENLLVAHGAQKEKRNIYGLTYTEGLRPMMNIHA